MEGRALGELFLMDARADEKSAWVGGHEAPRGRPKCALAWFAFELVRPAFPWAWGKDGNPKRVISSLELLGTIIGLKLFGPAGEVARRAPGGPAVRRPGEGRCGATGATDNQGNSYAVAKAMSTKWPSAVLLLELSEELREQDLALELKWIPRGENTWADALSNLDLEGFDPTREVKVDQVGIAWRVLGDAMSASEALYNRVLETKRLAAKRPAVALPGPAHKRAAVLPPW